MVNILVSNRFDIYCYSLQLSKEKAPGKKGEKSKNSYQSPRYFLRIKPTQHNLGSCSKIKYMTKRAKIHLKRNMMAERSILYVNGDAQNSIAMIRPVLPNFSFRLKLALSFL